MSFAMGSTSLRRSNYVKWFQKLRGVYLDKIGQVHLLMFAEVKFEGVFLKTSVILTPGALFVGWKSQCVFQLWGIWGIRRRVQKSCFGGPHIAVARSGDLNT